MIDRIRDGDPEWTLKVAHYNNIVRLTRVKSPIERKSELTAVAHRPYLVFERDDGAYEVSDGRVVTGPFPSRRFAEQVASERYVGDDPPPDPETRSPAVGDGRANRKAKARAGASDLNGYSCRSHRASHGARNSTAPLRISAVLA